MSYKTKEKVFMTCLVWSGLACAAGLFFDLSLPLFGTLAIAPLGVCSIWLIWSGEA